MLCWINLLLLFPYWAVDGKTPREITLYLHTKIQYHDKLQNVAVDGNFHLLHHKTLPYHRLHGGPFLQSQRECSLDCLAILAKNAGLDHLKRRTDVDHFLRCQYVRIYSKLLCGKRKWRSIYMALCERRCHPN